jgi:hypothetical protein
MYKKNLNGVSAILAKSSIAGIASAPLFAHADTVDFTQLTSGIDFSSVTSAVLAVGVVLMGVYVAIKGAKIILSMVRGA